MNNEIEKISIDNFGKILKNDNVATLFYGDKKDKFEVHVKRTIPLSDMLLLVQEVVESCIDGENGEYLPEACEFAIRRAVLTYYTNIDMSEKSLEEQYSFLYNTTVYKDVYDEIDGSQYYDIVAAIDKKIKYMLDIMSSTAVSKIIEVISKFNDIVNDSNKMFGQMSEGDLSNFVKEISNLKDMKEEDLAKAILHVRSREQ